MDLRALVEARATAYRAIQARAGVSLRCLDPDAAEAPPITSLTAAADDDARALTVRVQGPLDAWFGFDVRALIADLDDADPQSIHLLIESPGGFLSDGLALYNDLRGRARNGVTVTAEARGVVASAAVLPFLAAETRTMTTGTELMVHNPFSLLLLAGTADMVESRAAQVVAGLRSAEKTYREVIADRTGASRQKVTTCSRMRRGLRRRRPSPAASPRRCVRTRQRPRPPRMHRRGPWLGACWPRGGSTPTRRQQHDPTDEALCLG